MPATVPGSADASADSPGGSGGGRRTSLDVPVLVAAARFLSLGMGLISAPILARGLGVEDRGVGAAMVAALTVTPVLLGLGVPLALRRRFAVIDRASAEAPALITAARVLVLASFPAAVASAWALLEWIFVGVPWSAAVMFFMAMGLSPLTVSFACDVSVLVARREYALVALLNVVQSVAFVVGVAAFWIAGELSIPTLLIAHCCSTALSFLAALLSVRLPLARPGNLVPLLREGVRLAGSQLAEVASWRLDQILVLPLAGAGAAGLYAVASTVGAIPLSVAMAVSAATFSGLAAADGEQLRALAGRALRTAALASAAVALLLAAATPIAVPWLFGAAFAGSVGPTLVALLGSVAMSMAFVGTMVLAAADRGWAMTGAQLTGLAAGIGLLVVLAGPLGAMGAAAASSAGYGVTLIVVLMVLRVPLTSLVVRRSDLRVARQTLFARAG